MHTDSAASRSTDEADGPATRLDEQVVRVGVHPAGERRLKRRLFAALEQAYAVRFEGRDAGDWGDLDGTLLIGDALPAVPPPELPCLRALGEERALDSPRQHALLDRAEIERPLRGARLTDGWTTPLDGDALIPGDIVLATTDGQPSWAASARGAAPSAIVSSAPAELSAGEPVRERLTPGRCLALLALVQFLRSLPRGEPALTPPLLRATFVIDDPNLHWTSYGHISYEELARDALAHDYHVAVAMVPLDGWLADPRAVRLFKRHARQLSICVHGNDHRGPELGMVRSVGDGVALAGQALSRAQAFERRTGVTVDRVMVPPHEKLSEAAARGLLAAGFEAVCASRPYPWIVDPSRRSPLAAPPERGALAGWTSREIVAGGLPLLLRAGFNAPRDDLALRAFLGQPLVLYGHHDLLAEGPSLIAEAAAAINALGDVRWGSLADVARAGVKTRLVDHTLEVSLLARRAKFSVPSGVSELYLSAAALRPSTGTWVRTVRNGRPLGALSPATSPVVLEVEPGEVIDVSVVPEVQIATRRSTRPRLSPLVRRLASEARDRARR